jgi:hypothetical protein
MNVSDILKFDSYLTKNIRGPADTENVIEMEEYQSGFKCVSYQNQH